MCSVFKQQACQYLGWHAGVAEQMGAACTAQRQQVIAAANKCTCALLMRVLELRALTAVVQDASIKMHAAQHSNYHLETVESSPGLSLHGRSRGCANSAQHCLCTPYMMRRRVLLQLWFTCRVLIRLARHV
jgi:hypothetical protein